MQHRRHPSHAEFALIVIGRNTTGFGATWVWIGKFVLTMTTPHVSRGSKSRQTMAKEGQFGLDSITGALAEAPKRAPPVELWDPPFCGNLDMRIAADGTWHYLKTPIARPALVKLFASVLKREGDNYFLVTPVEKCGVDRRCAIRCRRTEGGRGRLGPGAQFPDQCR